MQSLKACHRTTHIHELPACHGFVATPTSDLMSEKGSRRTLQPAQTRRWCRLAYQLGEVVELVIGVVEQYVLLGDGVEGVDETVEIAAIEGRQLGVFQIVPAHVGEADEILEVVIAPAGHDGVVGADLQLELQEAYHRRRHLPLVDEAHRHGSEALFQARDKILIPIGVFPFFMLVFLTGFEVLVAFLQAYIFTILAAVYIAGAVHPEH